MVSSFCCPLRHEQIEEPHGNVRPGRCCPRRHTGPQPPARTRARPGGELSVGTFRHRCAGALRSLRRLRRMADDRAHAGHGARAARRRAATPAAAPLVAAPGGLRRVRAGGSAAHLPGGHRAHECRYRYLHPVPLDPADRRVRAALRRAPAHRAAARLARGGGLWRLAARAGRRGRTPRAQRQRGGAGGGAALGPHLRGEYARRGAATRGSSARGRRQAGGCSSAA